MEAALAVAMHTEKYRADNNNPQASSGGKRPVGAPSVKRTKKSKDGFERKSYADIKKEEEAEGFVSEESDQDDKVEAKVEVEVRGASTESVGVDNWAQCDSCNKWRRVPAAAFPLPARWFCKMNPARCTASGGGQWSCAVPEALEEEEDHVVETVAADGCYVVERLLAKRRHHSEVQYLVRWAGFTEASDTWEPAANIGKKVVQSFDQGQTMSPPPRFSAGPGLSQQAGDKYQQLMAEGWRSASVEDWRRAAESYLDASRLRRDEPVACLNLGAAFNALGHEAEAALCYLEAQKRAPAGSECWAHAAATAFDLLRLKECDAVAKPRWWNDEGLKTLSASVVGAAPNFVGAHRMLAIVLSGLCGGVWEVGPRSAAELKDAATHFERSMALCGAPSGELTRCADWCRSQAEAVDRSHMHMHMCMHR